MNEISMIIPEPPVEERKCYKCPRSGPEAALRGRMENGKWIYACRWHRSGETRHYNWRRRQEKKRNSLWARIMRFLRRTILNRRKSGKRNEE